MSTKSNDTTGDESPDSYVEIYSTKLEWRNGQVRAVVVSVEYFGPRAHDATKNKVTFDVDDLGVAHLSGWETPIATVEDLRVIPAAEYVALSVDGVDDVRHGFSVVEDQLNAGHQAVENRLEMDSVPDDLRAGFDSR